MAESNFDLLILGSGSTAFAAGLRAREHGKTVVMIEERRLGGTCVNRGCLPSKNLIGAARLIHDARHPRYAGLTPAEVTPDFPRLTAQKDEVVHAYRDKKYESLLGRQFQIERGRAQFLDAHRVRAGAKVLRGEKLLIATGARPVVPPIAGLDQVPYLTSDFLASDEAMELKEQPRSLVIIGGGYIALELGQMFRRFGSEVTILERSRQLLPHGYEPEVGKTLAEIFSKEGMRVVTDAAVQSVRQEEHRVAIAVQVRGVKQEYRADKLLVATGRRPNTDRIGIDKAGVRLGGRGQVLVDEYLRTSRPHIYAAGDVIGCGAGSRMATPVGGRDGGIAADNALIPGPPRAVDHRIIPRAIFTDPEVGVVGLTAAEAEAQGRTCWHNTVPMSLVPRAGAIHRPDGFVKMVADAETSEVLGVSMVGHNAAEVIHEAAMGLRFRAKLRDFIDLLHVYPTMAEALKIVAISRYKDPNKLSCCAE